MKQLTVVTLGQKKLSRAEYVKSQKEQIKCGMWIQTKIKCVIADEGVFYQSIGIEIGLIRDSEYRVIFMYNYFTVYIIVIQIIQCTIDVNYIIRN